MDDINCTVQFMIVEILEYYEIYPWIDNAG